MKTLTSAIATLCFTTTAFAATLSCPALTQAYRADTVAKTAFKCTTQACEARQLGQLQQTIKFFSDGDNTQGTLKQLTDKYQAYFTTYSVGSKTFEGANIDLGDNGFELLFNADTTTYSGIQISDGDILVDNKFCAGFELAPVISAMRMHNICMQVVPAVAAKLPAARYNMKTCENKTPVDPKTGNVTDFSVNDFDTHSLEVRVARNLQDVNGGYFSCTAKLNRTSNYVFSLTCEVN